MADYYKRIVKEIYRIGKLYPEWSITSVIQDGYGTEGIFNISPVQMFILLRDYREKLEADPRVISSEEEINKIIEEGMKIAAVIAKEQLYGKD